MARGRLINLWRRWSQLTAGSSTAAKKRAMTNQPKKVLTFHKRKSAPSTTTVVSKAVATVRTTCEVGAPAHPGFLLGPDALGWAAAVSGFACGFACESSCGTFPSSISLASAARSRVRPFGDAVSILMAELPSCGFLPPSLVVSALTAALLVSPSLCYARVDRLRPACYAELRRIPLPRTTVNKG